MKTAFPYTQVRIARPVKDLEATRAFYENGLGLPIIGKFKDHDGYDGIMLGMPGKEFHLEFTMHRGEGGEFSSDEEDLVVFYHKDVTGRNKTAERLRALGFHETRAKNPWWQKNGRT